MSKSSSSFYFEDNNESDDSVNRSHNNSQTSIFQLSSLRQPKSAISSVFPVSDTPLVPASLFESSNEILNFPTESTNAYSYARLSPNSLALRLNVLKRSLEILIERPDLIYSLDSSSDSDALATVRPPTPITNPSSLFNPKIRQPQVNCEPAKETRAQIKIETNASSAALAAFFRSNDNHTHSKTSLAAAFDSRKPFAKRSSSLNTPILLTNKRISSSDVSKYANRPHVSPVVENSAEEASIYENIRGKLKSMISLLSTDGNSSTSTSNEIALGLHDLSLSNVHDENRESLLQKKLLYALATPFYESISTNNMINLNRNISSAALFQKSTPKNQHNLHQLDPPVRIPLKKYNSFDDSVIQTSGNRLVVNASTSRPFHSLSTSKKINPQAIITCDVQEPWNLKAVNDLSTLIFGLKDKSDAGIKSLGLLDLIANNSKNFVAQKLRKRLSSSFPNTLKSQNRDIIFAGEIVAVSSAGHEISWCSIWAKRIDNIVILMFDKIPCAALDLVVVHDTQWKIDSFQEISERLFTNLNLAHYPLRNFSRSLTNQLDTSKSADVLNDKRYFTINLKDENMPCAVLAEPINESSMVLKIHTLPYIAGIFVVSAKTYAILSHNRSISKNLFGYDDLIGQSISTIIPTFVKLLEFSSSTKKLVTFLNDLAEKSTPETLKESSSNPKPLLPGLVLPEHFFRRISAMFEAHRICSSSSNVKPEDEIEEELFLNSKGILGKHSDGSNLTIDVQLRVSTIDTLVLWVTYSNDSYKNLTRSSVTSSPRTRSGSVLSIGEGSTTPKKRVKFDEEEETENSSDTSTHSDAIRRNNSLLSNLSDSSNSTTLPKTPSRSSDGSSKVEFDMSTTPDSATPLILEPFEKPKLEPLELEKLEEDPNLVIRSENELYDNDEASYNLWKSKCKNFPEVIGQLRRKKSFSMFKVLRKMGEGAYGKVLLVSSIEDPTYEVILKCIYKERILVDSWTRDRKLGTIPIEIQVMSFLNANPHPNNLKLIDFFEDDEFFYVELPIHGHPPAIELFDYIEIKKHITEREIKYVFRQIVQSIHHLHSHGLVHRDIKDENVIIDENSVVKLIDYGSAAFVNGGPFGVFVGTMEYAPPEVLQGCSYDGRPQDVWSLGVLLYTMVYKENPFYNVDNIIEGELKVPYILSEECIGLIQRILNRDVEKRPTIEEILEDIWLKE